MTNAAIKLLRRRTRERNRSADKRLRLRLEGLTSRGKPRRLKIWPLHLFCYNCHTERDKKLVRQRVTRRENMARGLRADGKPRRNHTWPELSGMAGRPRMIRRIVLWTRRRRAALRVTPLQTAWMEFRQVKIIAVLLFFIPFLAAAETGRATWEQLDEAGKAGAYGIAYDPMALTCATRHWPRGAHLRVTEVHTGVSVVVTVTDRNPRRGALLDLSWRAFGALAGHDLGVVEVRVEEVRP